MELVQASSDVICVNQRVAICCICQLPMWRCVQLQNAENCTFHLIECWLFGRCGCRSATFSHTYYWLLIAVCRRKSTLATHLQIITIIASNCYHSHGSTSIVIFSAFFFCCCSRRDFSFSSSSSTQNDRNVMTAVANMEWMNEEIFSVFI